MMNRMAGGLRQGEVLLEQNWSLLYSINGGP
jgi:hypothetical protein